MLAVVISKRDDRVDDNEDNDDNVHAKAMFCMCFYVWILNTNADREKQNKVQEMNYRNVQCQQAGI